MMVCGTNPMTTEVANFLPDIAKAREQGVRLPDVAPVSQTRVAAVIVMARAVRRNSWDQIVRDDSAAASYGEAFVCATTQTRACRSATCTCRRSPSASHTRRLWSSLRSLARCRPAA